MTGSSRPALAYSKKERALRLSYRVLRAAGESRHRATDLVVTSDHGIESTRLGLNKNFGEHM